MEQALIQSKIPFSPIFDEHLSQLSSGAYKVLILPDSECLSDEQIGAIREYVKMGGGLVVTGQAGFYDSWRRERVTPGFADLINYQAPATVGEISTYAAQAASALALRKEYGRGRVAYLPNVEFDGPLPPAEPYFVLDTRFWKRPRNWKELMDAVSWAARDDVMLRVQGPDFLGVNLVEQSDKQRRLIHVVNFNVRNVPSIEKIEVRCAMPAGKPARAVNLYSAEMDAHEALSFRMQGGEAVFAIPKLNAYCVVTVDC